jgi:iron complex outermembrane receptor protein
MRPRTDGTRIVAINTSPDTARVLGFDGLPRAPAYAPRRCMRPAWMRAMRWPSARTTAPCCRAPAGPCATGLPPVAHDGTLDAHAAGGVRAAASYKLKTITRRRDMKLKTLLAALAAAGLASSAYAAGQVEEQGVQADKADEAKAGKMARVEVTGSSLKRINAETASPVQVIDAKQIENMGARTLLQVLDNLPAARPAQQDFRSMFTGSDGGSQANLRGLGAQGTLVLLNGRRLSFYGAPSGFQTMFVNIDAIPAAAIERMEVLTDGASAVYGSDAVAGVINVITKKNYQGLEVRASNDSSARVSSYGERQGSILFGKGDLGNDGYNVYGSLNLYQRDRIALADTYDKRPEYFYVNNPTFIPNFRIGTGSEPGVMNPGTLFVFDPAKNNARTQRAVNGCPSYVTEASGTRCVWNNLPYALDTGPSSKRATGYLAGRLRLSDGWEGFAEGAYTHIRMRGENGPRSFNSGSTSNWFSRNTGTTLNTFVNPYLGPNNVYLKGRLDPDMAARWAARRA